MLLQWIVNFVSDEDMLGLIYTWHSNWLTGWAFFRLYFKYQSQFVFVEYTLFVASLAICSPSWLLYRILVSLSVPLFMKTVVIIFRYSFSFHMLVGPLVATLPFHTVEQACCPNCLGLRLVVPIVSISGTNAASCLEWRCVTCNKHIIMLHITCCCFVV